MGFYQENLIATTQPSCTSTKDRDVANFAAISDGITDDDEFLDLHPDHQHIWLVLLISRIGGKCGIFKGSRRALSLKCGRDISVVNDAFEAFAELGWLKIDGDYCWIRNKIKHQSNSTNWLTGALAEAKGYLGSTELASQCLAVYSPSDAVQRPSTPISTTAQHTTAQPTKPQEENPPAADTTAAERATLAEIQTNWTKLGYQFKYQNCLDQIRQLGIDYPQLDLLDVAKQLTAWARGGKREIKNWLSQYRNFCSKAYPATSGSIQQPAPSLPTWQERRAEQERGRIPEGTVYEEV